MLWRKVQLQLPCDPACLSRCKGRKQRGGGVRIQIIYNQSNHFRLGKMHIEQLPHLDGEVILRAMRCDVDVPPHAQRLDEEKEIGRAFAAIFIIVQSGLYGNQPATSCLYQAAFLR